VFSSFILWQHHLLEQRPVVIGFGVLQTTWYSSDDIQRSTVGKSRSRKPLPARCRPVSGHIPRFSIQMRINTIVGKHGNDRSRAIGGQNGKTEKYPVPFFANQVHLLGI
jgi:hypothetical protein